MRVKKRIVKRYVESRCNKLFYATTEEAAKVERMFPRTFHAPIYGRGAIKLLRMLSTVIPVSLSFSYLVKFRRLRVSDRLCLTVFVRISVSVRPKSPARMRRGDSLSGPTATRLLRMHRGRDVVMRLQRRKCNGTNIPRPSSLSSQRHSTFTRLASSALLPPTGRVFNINRIVAMDISD